MTLTVTVQIENSTEEDLKAMSEILRHLTGNTSLLKGAQRKGTATLSVTEPTETKDGLQSFAGGRCVIITANVEDK